MSLLVPLVVILAVAYCCGLAARSVGQARVIGEMAGGILLGPTLLGRLAPVTWHALFTPATLAACESLSTVGLVLYLFLVGMQLDLSHLRRQRTRAVLATLTSLLLPFALALCAANRVQQAFGTVSNPIAFVLFFGIALSITAFPVLARILEERGLSTTPLGVTSLLCAAADDVVAWMLLAVAMTFLPHGSDSLPLLPRMVLAVLYGCGMTGIALLARRLAARHNDTAVKPQALFAALLLAIASAAATDALGLHALFGAFVAGLCFPRVPAWQAALRQRLDLPVSGVLLPVFFAMTGLRTHLDLLVSAAVLPWLAIILVLAVVGKVAGGVLAARLTGDTWRNAFGLGAMLNTRGLVELIVLNIALTQGVFPPALFAVLVVMALATTMMTSPLLHLLRLGETPSLH